MKKYRIACILSALACLMGCQENEDLQTPEASGKVIYASIEDNHQSRTGINPENGMLMWEKGDLVSVFYKNLLNQKYQIEDQAEGKNAGSLTCVSGTATEGTGQHIAAYYPYSENVSFTDGENPTLTGVSIPSKQEFALHDEALGNALPIAQHTLPMAALNTQPSEDINSLVFKNLCGVLEVSLKGTGLIKSITLQGNDNEKISGAMTVTWENGIPQATMAADETAETSITLDCSGGVQLSEEEATKFCFAVPACNFKKGISLTLTNTQDQKMVQRTGRAISIQRSRIQPMAEFSFIQLPKNNQIFYTTTDNEELVFKESALPSVTSHLFPKNNNGKGVITFASDVTAIGKDAFNNYLSNLATMVLPSSVKSIEDMAFTLCSKMTALSLPASLESIGHAAFMGCSQLRDIPFSSFTNLTKIDRQAFENCSSLTSAYLPEKLTDLGNNAFCECSALTEIHIPTSLKKIASSAFYKCTSLKEVTLHAEITEIGLSAFYGCTSLESVYLKPTTAPSINDYAFDNNAPGRKFYVPAGSIDSYQFEWFTWINYEDLVAFDYSVE